ncbi:hypothetical protein HZY88_03305 [Aerococcaceae bacterium DSM 111176]|nr:hypothetical protein [Aerococcaceae bacterium DSM 111176]
MKKNKKRQKQKDYEQMMEEEFGFDFIAGYTSGGVPFGITIEETEESLKENDENQLNKEDLPF